MERLGWGPGPTVTPGFQALSCCLWCGLWASASGPVGSEGGPHVQPGSRGSRAELSVLTCLGLLWALCLELREGAEQRVRLLEAAEGR